MALVRFDATSLTDQRLNEDEQKRLREAYRVDDQWELDKIIFGNFELARQLLDRVEAGETLALPLAPSIRLTHQ